MAMHDLTCSVFLVQIRRPSSARTLLTVTGCGRLLLRPTPVLVEVRRAHPSFCPIRTLNEDIGALQYRLYTQRITRSFHHMPLVLRGFSVSIACDGEEIPQYQTEVVNDKFLDRDEEPKIARLYADGRYIYGLARKAFDEPIALSTVQTSPTTVMPFQFSQTELTSDELASATPATLDYLGLLDVLPVGSVSEKSKKMGLNHVSFGPPVETPNKETKVYRILKGHSWKKPFVSFQFRHRPSALLQAMGIMPSPESTQEAQADEVPTEHHVSHSRRAGKRPSTSTTDDAAPSKKHKAAVAGASLSPSNHTKGGPGSFGPPEPNDSIDVKPGINDGAARLRALQDTIRAAQDEMDRIRSGKSANAVKAERLPSPIRVGSARGEVIDLTDD
ncbi:hypothetical protein OF83DRAFT_933193 [Amylostereum chailletii]|nr:hypothetical protein OF83DRAFT_933193 [Amylostereum chailletii]